MEFPDETVEKLARKFYSRMQAEDKMSFDLTKAVEEKFKKTVEEMRLGANEAEEKADALESAASIERERARRLRAAVRGAADVFVYKK